ncbi:MAG TPA: VIT domain-containing protein [Caldimonas sp.]|nr:VIT domain-containing protein [Caldimonas sp.]HEX4233605.1 VIT domain-containing protein [Caldimonas sp.]
MPRRSPLSVLGRRALRAAFAAACSHGALAFAQTPPLSAPTDVAWRAPLLRVAGAEQPIRLASLQVDVEVSGGAAQTRVQMVFFNPNQRILEGKLQFPLAPGQVVSGFALDVDGRLRAAVPVEKARAQQVFEDIARRRVDPGLLETTIGNNHELRVYPLLPGKTRTVELRIVEPASDRLQIPLAYADRVESLALSLRVPGTARAPELLAPAALGLHFERQPGGGFRALAVDANVALPKEPITLRMPAAGNDAAVAVEPRDGQVYFTLEVPVPQRTAARPLPRTVQIVWDASGSGAARRIDRELALLDAYFAAAGETTVQLVRVADVAAPPLRFDVRGGDWRALRRALESTVYDGASNLGAVRHDGVSQEVLWFSDGLANYGAPWRLAFAVPVYAINSAASSDSAALQALADATGGRSIDLVTMSRRGASDALLRRGSTLVGIDTLGVRDVVVQSQSVAHGRLVAAGVMTAGDAEVKLRIRDASGALTTRVVPVHARASASSLAALQWARLTLASLEGEARTHKARIREIGKRFGLATRETSLIVLEQVDDYVRNDIEPPAELRAAYDRIAANVVKRRVESDAARLAQVVGRFEARVAWWKRDFPKGDLPPPLAVAKQEPTTNTVGELSAGREEGRQRTDASQFQNKALERAAAPAPSTAPAVAAAQSRLGALQDDKGVVDSLAKKSADAVNAREAATTIAIAVTPAANASAAIQRLRSARADEWTRIYLDERRGNETNVGFFLDAAEFFLAKGDRDDRAQGLRALSNLAELDLQNRQVLRLLAYRLQQAGETAAAVPIFERVLELAPNEPQSHRDLGLALADAGQAQAAVDHLYAVVTGAWDGRFADIDLIALTELNAIVDKARRDGKPLDTERVDPRLLRNLPVDVRVVLAWDADNTDVDLHVFDPNGEEVYYGHNLSYQGGAITRDATSGYGPEEFALKVAKPGRYRVVADFFGHRQQLLATGTGLMLWFSSGYGSAAQQDRRTTLRIKSERGERVAVGEFEVLPKP